MPSRKKKVLGAPSVCFDHCVRILKMFPGDRDARGVADRGVTKLTGCPILILFFCSRNPRKRGSIVEKGCLPRTRSKTRYNFVASRSSSVLWSVMQTLDVVVGKGQYILHKTLFIIPC
jgi:hypothetical protein